MAYGKNELVEAVALKTGFTKKDSKAAVEAVLNSIVETVTEGESVNIVGFGSFVPKSQKATTKLVPGTKKTVDVPAKVVPKFKAGKLFKDTVDSKN